MFPTGNIICFPGSREHEIMFPDISAICSTVTMQLAAVLAAYLFLLLQILSTTNKKIADAALFVTKHLSMRF